MVFVESVAQSLTFLCDADGAAAHPHSQRVHSCINQVLSLSCCHHCSRQGETEAVRHPQIENTLIIQDQQATTAFDTSIFWTLNKLRNMIKLISVVTADDKQQICMLPFFPMI